MLTHTLVWTAIGILTVVADPTGRLYMYLARVGWASQMMWLGGIELNVKGLENIDRKRSYVICANHQSLIDIPALFAGLPIPFRFLAKRSLFYIPIFGWSLFLARFIPVDRGRGAKSRESIRRAAERIRNGPSLAIFPEGTRSADGELQEFKSGAFVMAASSGIPILPVVIRGTFQVAPKTGLTVTPHPVQLIVGRPIECEGMQVEDRKVLKEKTRAAMVEMKQAGEPA